MSPILLRPIREQVEHDRVIRQLQTRLRRRFEVAANIGSDEETSVKIDGRVHYPDLILTNTTGGRRLHGLVEVETAESVNHLEAMAEWKHFAKARGAFYLYVPAGFTDVVERLCQGAKINVTEVWAYYAIGSQVKFSMTYRSPRAKLAAKTASTRKPTRSTNRTRKRAPSTPTSRATGTRTKSGAGRAKKKAETVAKKKAVTSRKKVATKRKTRATRTSGAAAKKWKGSTKSARTPSTRKRRT